jgi:hypothetical protein
LRKEITNIKHTDTSYVFLYLSCNPGKCMGKVKAHLSPS